MTATTTHTAARWWTLAATILGSAVGFLDMTVLGVALPAIADDLDFDLVGQLWVNNSYLLALVAFYLVAGGVGDRLGQRPVFVAGTAGFALASAGAAAAPSLDALVLARVLTGVAGAFLTTTSLALLRLTWGSQSGRAIGYWTAGTSVATVAGPFAGGLLTDHASWRWVFLINLPIAALAVLCALAGRTEQKPTASRSSSDDASPPRFDVAGGLLGAAAVTGLTYFLVQGAESGFRTVWWSAAVAGLCSALFVLQERRAAAPILPMRLFHNRNLAVANLATFLVYGALGGSMLFLGLYLQSDRIGYSATVAGLWSTPTSVFLILFSGRFGALAARHGPRTLLTLGPLLMTASFVAFAAVDSGGDVVALGMGQLLFGIGLSMVVAPITATALQGAPSTLAGTAAAVNVAVARLAAVVASSLIAVAIAATFTGSAQPGEVFARDRGSEQRRRAAGDAFRAAMVVAGLLALGGAAAARFGIDNALAQRDASEG